MDGQCERCNAEVASFLRFKILDFYVLLCTPCAREWDHYVRLHPIWKRIIANDARRAGADSFAHTVRAFGREHYGLLMEERNQIVLDMHRVYAEYCNRQAVP